LEEKPRDQPQAPRLGVAVPKNTCPISAWIWECVRTKAGRKILLKKKIPFAHRVWKQRESEVGRKVLLMIFLF